MKFRSRVFKGGLRNRIRSTASRLERVLPRPCGGTRDFPHRPVERIVVFGRLPNPTIDYYFSARLQAEGMPPSQIVDIRDETLASLPADGTLVVICRYASRRLLTWIERNAPQLAGVALFLDDDIGAVVAWAEAKLLYRIYLYRLALAPLRRLNRHLDVVWTSTPALAQALADPRATVLPPAPPIHLTKGATTRLPVANGGRVRIVYHATVGHAPEHRFLRPIIAAVLAARPDVSFEVTAEGREAKIWSSVPGVHVTRPTTWSSYVQRTHQHAADIVLVPLTKSRINETRADTKRIDVVRMDAAGVFSVSTAYGAADGSGEVRLPNRRGRWIEEILKLVDDPMHRRDVARASKALVEDAARRAHFGIPGLLPVATAFAGGHRNTIATSTGQTLSSGAFS